jgi:hypothetical protein
MGTLEYWVLRIADNDLTWMGFNWMRPARTTRVGFCYILFSSFFLGLPGLLLGATAIYLFCGRISPTVWLTLFSLVMLVEVPLHLLFAHYWNRRAAKLAQAAFTTA